MAKIRHLKIENFRAFSKFEWRPGPGLNCLIGSGDSGKSTLLNAIDLTLGARQTKLFSDADFHLLNTDAPIKIEVTVGDLAEPLKNLDKYDLFLRGYNLATGEIEDEPADGLENALTICLTVSSDLDPVWSLFSDRAQAQGREKNLSWGDRVLLAPTRIGHLAEYHLSWRKGAVLNRMGDEAPNTLSAIAEAKRAARDAFGASTQPNLEGVLSKVSSAASHLGVQLEGDLQALLNAHSISLSGGTISVHDGNGLPLSALGLGSSRLLVAGLLNEAKIGSDIILVDELEHGLEPHRIMRFLDTIGAKSNDNVTQSFITSHSPVVLRELSDKQLFRIQPGPTEHSIACAEIDASSQGALRSFPEAFLAKSVFLCEGSSEVGFLRGFDQDFVSKGRPSIWAAGVSLVDAGGVSRLYNPAPTLQALGYRVASFRDDDAQPVGIAEADFIRNRGFVFKWEEGIKLEEAIINASDETLIGQILDLGAANVGEDKADEHVRSASENRTNFQDMRQRALDEALLEDDKRWLVTACTYRSNSWFKSVSRMEALIRDVIAKSPERVSNEFRTFVKSMFEWARNG